MILLSVGTQFPFDRLVKAVDEWAVRVGRTDILAQIGPSKYQPRMMKCFGLVSPNEFRDMQEKAELIIAHAGMGSILTAMEMNKPIIVFPRDHTLGEHRNAHQQATADRFEHTPGIFVVRDTESLLDRLNNTNELFAAKDRPRVELHRLADNLRTFVNQV